MKRFWSSSSLHDAVSSFGFPAAIQKSKRASVFSANCENSTNMFCSLLILRNLFKSIVAMCRLRGLVSSLIVMKRMSLFVDEAEIT